MGFELVFDCDFCHIAEEFGEGGHPACRDCDPNITVVEDVVLDEGRIEHVEAVLPSYVQ